MVISTIFSESMSLHCTRRLNFLCLKRFIAVIEIILIHILDCNYLEVKGIYTLLSVIKATGWQICGWIVSNKSFQNELSVMLVQV